MSHSQATFRFYEELNDFLPSNKVKRSFTYSFDGSPSVKDAIESIGIPHVEVDMIIANGQSVDFTYSLQNNDYVSVYPIFETLNISHVTHLRERPLRDPKFILDVHLGKLAKHLRMLGFDSLYRNNYDDIEIISTALAEHRIILTRDLGLLKVRRVTHGYWLRSQHSKEQTKEVINHFDLYTSINPFNRCIKCNGTLESIEKNTIIDKLKPLTKQIFNNFYHCRDCGRIFWEGSHYQKMNDFIRKIKNSNL